VTKYRKRPFNCTDFNTWKKTHIKNRAGHHFKTNQCNALVVVACFTRLDVPGILRTHFLDQQDMALIYESAVIDACRNHDILRTMINHERDDGGGGRKAKTCVGHVLYVAIRTIMYCEENSECPFCRHGLCKARGVA
jgi:hypothetical protein